MKADCDNNATIEWDKDFWKLFASNLIKKTKCNLCFKNLESINVKLNDLVNSDTTNIASNDPDGNIRYIGAKSNNYGNAYSTDDARASIFLKSNIIINSGDGSRTNPYQLSF